MKKRLIIICLIVAGIFSAAVSDTMSIYTKSFNYNITLEDPRPLKPEEFYCYEINKGNYPFGKVDFDVAGQKITLHDESGAMRTMTADHEFDNYTVHAQIDSISNAFKNFGVSFNGSYIASTTNIRMDHYVMFITEDYKLQVRKQSVHNNVSGNVDHKNDEYNENFSNFTPVDNVFKNGKNFIDVSKFFANKNSTDPLNIQIKVSCTKDDKLDLYFYIDNELVNEIGTISGWDDNGKYYEYTAPIPFRISHDLRKDQTSKDGTSTIGVNSYGINKIVTSLLYAEQWDGKDFKAYQS